MCALVTGVQTCALPISWLTDRRGGLAFPVPCGPVTHIDRRSPLTVAGAAPVLHRLPVLASRRASDAKNLDSIQHRPAASLVNSHIKNSLYGYSAIASHAAVAATITSWIARSEAHTSEL